MNEFRRTVQASGRQDRNFIVDGILFPDRTPHPAYEVASGPLKPPQFTIITVLSIMTFLSIRYYYYYYYHYLCTYVTAAAVEIRVNMKTCVS